jgi:hypothetical protein
LATILKRGQKKGVFRRLDAWHTAVNIVGACCFYYCTAQRLQSVWPGDRKPLSAEMIEQHGEEAVNLIMCGVLV